MEGDDDKEESGEGLGEEGELVEDHCGGMRLH